MRGKFYENHIFTMEIYKTTTVPVGKLSPELIERMSCLYLENYDGSSDEIFRNDLSAKDEVILLLANDELVGFRNLQVFQETWRSKNIRVVYSGDTIVAPAHWGQQQLAFSWISRICQIKLLAPETPLYWLLLVKGHRTFKYLSVFGNSFYPHWEIDRSDLKPLADQLAGSMFPNAYNATSGIVEFAESRGHLRHEIANASDEELSKPGTRHFFCKNPGYLRGHELVCLCELELANMKPLTARIFKNSMRSVA